MQDNDSKLLSEAYSKINEKSDMYDVILNIGRTHPEGEPWEKAVEQIFMWVKNGDITDYTKVVSLLAMADKEYKHIEFNTNPNIRKSWVGGEEEDLKHRKQNPREGI